MSETAPQGPKKGLDRNKVALVLATLTGLVASIAYWSSDSGDRKGAPPDPSLRRKLEMKGEACGILVKTKEKLHKMAGNRRNIVERLAILGKCTDPSAPEFNFQGVCAQISEGLRSASPKWKHPFLNPFYVMLYDELKCARNERGGDLKPEIQALFQALQQSDAIKQYRLLDADQKIDDICKDAVDFIKFPPNFQAIQEISRFILKKSPSLRKESELGQLVERARQSYRDQNDKKEPTDADLLDVIGTYLGYASAAVKVPFLCTLGAENIIAFVDKKKRLTPEMLTEKRRLAMPIVRELLVLLKDAPDDEDTKRASAAVLRLAQSLSTPGRRMPQQ